MRVVPYRTRDVRRKRRPLDQAQVVRAALALLDEVGVDELTMRRLAQRLGVKAASLYRHVRDKSELLMLLGDEISGEIPMVPPTGPWRTRLIAMATAARRGLLAHRDAPRVLAMTAPFGARRLRLVDAILGVLREAGLSKRDAVRLGYHMNNSLTEFIADEARLAALPGGPRGLRRKMFDDMRRQFEALPPAEYPTLVDLAAELSEDDPDSLFQFGLEIWLRSIEALAKRDAPGRPARVPPPTTRAT